jgi:hypothetical protein
MYTAPLLRRLVKDRAIGRLDGTTPKPRMARRMQRVGEDPVGDDGDDPG